MCKAVGARCVIVNFCSIPNTTFMTTQEINSPSSFINYSRHFVNWSGVVCHVFPGCPCGCDSPVPASTRTLSKEVNICFDLNMN